MTTKTKSARKKVKETKSHRVYCTYFPDGRYYIGYSCKSLRAFEKYFGSGRIVLEADKSLLVKEVIYTSPNKNSAKLQELLLQLQQMKDPKCLNDMLHIRLRSSHLKDFVSVHWTPRGDTRTFVPNYIRDWPEQTRRSTVCMYSGSTIRAAESVTVHKD